MEASKLKEIRQELSISQYQIQKDTGIAYNTLTRIFDTSFDRISRSHMRLLRDFFKKHGKELTLEDFLS